MKLIIDGEVVTTQAPGIAQALDIARERAAKAGVSDRVTHISTGGGASPSAGTSTDQLARKASSRSCAWLSAITSQSPSMPCTYSTVTGSALAFLKVTSNALS